MGVLYARVGGAWIEVGGQAGGVSDHGLLTGLADDDHPQYLKALPNAAPRKYRAVLPVLGSTPVTSWTQFNFGTPYETSGNWTIQANPGGVFISEAGWYAATWTVMTDRNLANLYMNIKYGARHVGFMDLPAQSASWRYSVSCVFAVEPAGINQWVTINAQTSTPTWLGGQLADDDRFHITSLF